MLEKAKPVFVEPKYQGGLSVLSALQLLRMSADKGYIPAEGFLGSIYYWGRNVPKNKVLASYWIERGATHNDVWSLVALGEMKYDGTGGYQRNEAEAVVHWRAAADWDQRLPRPAWGGLT
jgi:TPR repeat protein